MNARNEHPVEWLPDLAEGDPENVVTGDVRDHVGSCESCRRELEEIRGVVATLSEIPRVSPAFIEKAMVNLVGRERADVALGRAAAPVKPLSWFQKFLGGPPALQWAAAAALTAAIVVPTYLALDRERIVESPRMGSELGASTNVVTVPDSDVLIALRFVGVNPPRESGARYVMTILSAGEARWSLAVSGVEFSDRYLPPKARELRVLVPSRDLPPGAYEFFLRIEGGKNTDYSFPATFQVRR